MSFELCICIITYNRGERALENVRYILQNIKNNICVLVLDNASYVGVNEYKEIEKLTKNNTHLSYIRHSTNILVHGNFRSCFQYAKSKYVMVISDEDFVNFDDLDEILFELNKHEQIGACRTSVAPHKELKEPANSYIFSDSYYKAGEEALKGFCFVGNYISGIIYSLENIKKTNLLDILDKNIVSHKAYPHLYFDLLVASQFDIMLTSKIGVFEGKAEKTLIENGTTNTMPAHLGLYGYSERTNQFLAFRDAIYETVNIINTMDDSEKIGLFIELYLRLFSKYFYLIFKVNICNYEDRMEIGLLKESFFLFACSSILNYKFISKYREIVLDLLMEVYQNYKHE